MKCGFVSVIGNPNVGKSSIINRLVGEKVAIVSPKPQTTRTKILGILNEEDLQIVFIDTPGFIKPTSKLNEYMAKNIESAGEGVDACLFVVDASKGISEKEFEAIKRQKSHCVVAVNKMDLVSYEKVFPEIAKLNEIEDIEVVPVSAKNRKNLAELKKVLLKYIPEGEAMYPRDEFTDKNLRFMVSEIVREKMLWLLNDEVPHGVNVEILTFEDAAKKIVISANIVCERDAHKPIIIGKNGAMLKQIGEKSRLAMEKLTGKKVYLDLFVKVRENWRDNEGLLKSFGFDKKNI